MFAKIKQGAAVVDTIFTAFVFLFVVWPFAVIAGMVDYATGRTDDYDRK